MIQVLIWEKEMSRVKYEDAYMYDQFAVGADFEAAEAFAKSRDIIVWSNRNEMVLVVIQGAHQMMKDYFKSMK